MKMPTENVKAGFKLCDFKSLVRLLLKIITCHYSWDDLNKILAEVL